MSAALAAAGEALRAAGVDSARLDAELLLAEAMAVERTRLAGSPEAPVEAPAARAFGAMVRRRVAREPVAYILGRKGFRGIELRVDRRALIPRPETEMLVELALELRPGSVLDVGSGSGAVALAVAEELPGCRVLGTDLSSAAVALATENAARLGLTARARFEHGSMPASGGFDLLLANLPYVRDDQWRGLQPEISGWEPREALLGGEDGLVAIRALLAGLVRQGSGPRRARALGLEVGAGQAPAVAAMVAAAGYAAEVRADLAGIDRCVVGRLS